MNINGKKVIIRPKKPADAENDYRWQTDPELSALDAMAPSAMSYREFYREYINWLRHPYAGRITFGVDTPEGKHIGNCVYWSKGYGTDTISTLIDYIFQNLKFKRVYLKTLEQNFHAQKCFQKCGLTACGHREQEGYKFLLMELSFTRWQEIRNNTKRD